MAIVIITTDKKVYKLFPMYINTSNSNEELIKNDKSQKKYINSRN